ncbi:hypothetical protein TNCV_2315381 [Trichonephila clavipes]|nr:hypothetical protein TNCV_2315381 [Trichonephila clavipes]
MDNSDIDKMVCLRFNIRRCLGGPLTLNWLRGQQGSQLSVVRTAPTEDGDIACPRSPDDVRMEESGDIANLSR